MKQQRVAVVAAAASPIGRYARLPGAEQWPEATRLTQLAARALNEAGVPPESVGSALFTLVSPNCPQQGFASHVASRLGLRCHGQIAQLMEMGITGGLAFDQAAADILLGRADFAMALGVAVNGVENPSAAMLQGLRVVGDADFQAPFGATPIAWYAMDAQRYLFEHKSDRAELASVAVKSRWFARHNPLAQFRDSLSLQQVLSARPVVEPLGLYEVPSVADGAICLVLASEPAAREFGKPYVIVRGRGFHHDGHHQIGCEYHDMTAFPAAREAASRALQQAGLTLTDVDLAELYAPCTISEVLVTEALGWFPRGHGARACAEGATSLGGAIPVNTSGGCLSRGHPPSLTALYGLLEVREQLLHHAGRRQVRNARLGLASCEGGNYNAAMVHVLEGPQ